MIKYFPELIQGGDEWLAARCGLLTASEMKLIISPEKLEPADNDKTRAHVWELLAQRITRYVEPKYVGSDMLRGQADEVEARRRETIDAQDIIAKSSDLSGVLDAVGSGLFSPDEPGRYRVSRHGEMLRCPWHGWEFDLRTGQSWCDPEHTWVKSYNVTVEPGAEIVQGPYVAETFPVRVEGEYLVVEL